MVNSLLKKGMITPAGFVKTFRNYARTVAPCMTEEVWLFYFAAFFFLMLITIGLISITMQTIISTKAMGCSAGLNIWRTSVSYTHLDVYKRQVEDNVMFEDAALTVPVSRFEPWTHDSGFTLYEGTEE